MVPDAELRWATTAYAFDDLREPPEMLAAYLASIRHLGNGGRPHWLISGNSDGNNLFGFPVAKAGFAVGWVDWSPRGGNSADSHHRFLDASRIPENAVIAIARQLTEEGRSKLSGGAYKAMIPRASHKCNPMLKYHDQVRGFDLSATINALFDLHSSANRFEQLHHEVTTFGRMKEESAIVHRRASELSGSSEANAANHVRTASLDTIVYPRSFCDMVCTMAVSPVDIGDFATLGQQLSAMAVEFRRALWRRGGIYAAGLQLSFVERTLSWWTHFDHYPMQSMRLVQSLLASSERFDCIGHVPERAMGYLPRLPRSCGDSATRQTLSHFWGLREEDRDSVSRSKWKNVGLASWLNTSKSIEFCVCGPSGDVETLQSEWAKA